MAMNGAESMLTCMSSLFTPTVLFCLLNLVIITIFITSLLKKEEKHHQSGGKDTVNPPPPQLVRVPSFLDRVKSFNFSSNGSEQPDPFPSVTQHADPGEEREQKVLEAEVLGRDHQMVRSKSETGMEAPATVGSRRNARSLSETVPFVEDDHEGVDEKADDFINRFRQQLKLQRLDSILRYKEMLNRGVGGE